MKLFLLSIILIFCQVESYSQVVLTNATNGVKLGYKRLLNYNWSNNQGYYPASANYTDKTRKVWDFHDMTILLSQWIESNYCNRDSTKIKMLEGDCAIHTNDYIVSAYNVGDTIMKFPLKLGDHFTSVYKNSLPFTYAIRSVEVDAAGKLILPAVTYEEALRIKTTQYIFDSSQSSHKFFKEERVTYRWYSPLTREYLFVIDTLLVTENQPSRTDFKVMSGYTNMFPLFVEDGYQKNIVTLYPNPSHKTIYIGGNNDIVRVVVKDVSGKVILSFDEKPDAIDFDNPGIYFITIVMNNEVSTQKVIVNNAQ